MTRPPIEPLEPRRMLDAVEVHADVNADNRNALYYGADDGSGLTLAGYTEETGDGWTQVEQYDFMMPSDNYLYGVAWDYGRNVAMWIGSFDLPSGLLVSSAAWQYIVITVPVEYQFEPPPPPLNQLASAIGNATSNQLWLTTDTWIPPVTGGWNTQAPIAKEAQAIWTNDSFFSTHLNDQGVSYIQYAVFRAPLDLVGRVRVVGDDDFIGGDTLTLSSDPADGDVKTTVLRPRYYTHYQHPFDYDVDPALIRRMDVALRDGDDTLSVNLSNGHVVFSDGLIVDGGRDTDTLLIDQIGGAEDGDMSSTMVRVGATEADFANIENLALELDDGSVTFDSDANLASATLPTLLTVGGAGDVFYDSTQHLNQFSIADAAVVEMAPGGDKVLVVKGLRIDTAGASTAKLNLADQDLIVDYTSGSPLAAIRSFIVTGYHAGDWLGNGLTSSSAAASVSGGNRTALGYAEASELFTTFPATFSGESIDDSVVLVKYTYAGDANLDGMVDIGDLSIMANHWGLPQQLWHQGDFNYDGAVDIGDFGLLAGNFNAGVGSPLGPIGLGAAGADDMVQLFLRLCSLLGLSDYESQSLLSMLNQGGQPQL